MNTSLPLSSSVPVGERLVVVAGLQSSVVLSPEGEIRRFSSAEAAAAIRDSEAPILCHAPSVARRLGVALFPSLDLLELFAFTRPAAPCLPTPAGLAAALDLEPPDTLEEQAHLLREATEELIAELHRLDGLIDSNALAIAEAMRDGNWSWGQAVTEALTHLADYDNRPHPQRGLDVWVRLTSWSEQAPTTAPESQPVEPEEARARLAELVGENAEPRPQQSDYASAVCGTFLPRASADAPNTVIAEAGTGVGKTLGYIAPASLWAEKNGGTVWVSTYTRNLQRQIDGELDRLHPDPTVKARRVVIRKGRENYLCLLNMEEAVGHSSMRPASYVALGLVARWVGQTRDGDIAGGDFPNWLADLVGYRDTLGLTDRRGECIYSACTHYNKCFIERTVRQARRADIVVANHALVMMQAAMGGLDDSNVPSRLIFDEGHHVFNASDSAFSAELSGRQGADLRRWLLGAEGGRGSRSRGLTRRLEDIAAIEETVSQALAEVVDAAKCLPAQGWADRICEGAKPQGPAEKFLSLVRQQVYARAKGIDTPYDLESDTRPAIDGLPDAAAALASALREVSRPMKELMTGLMKLLDDQAAHLDSFSRQRIDATWRGLRRRAEGEVDAWCSMLDELADVVPVQFVDWLSVSRDQGRDVDAAMHRHWIDPTIPFSQTVAQPAHGMLVTSATLRDGTGINELDWQAAEQVTGAIHLNETPLRAEVPSPFDYDLQTRVFIVNDVSRNNANQVAAAYRELFLAAGGGALGLFTAIARLRMVHSKLAGPLEKANLPLLAQHVDNLDTASLIDIFRAEENTCILGTDAIRDGVDVPGRSLRLVVFDRVPWARPTILHRARKDAFGGAAYDDRLARLKIKQAYGRLVRRANDTGVFVMLDSRTPSRLLGAFPDSVEVRRVGLAEAVIETKAFLEK